MTRRSRLVRRRQSSNKCGADHHQPPGEVMLERERQSAGEHVARRQTHPHALSRSCQRRRSSQRTRRADRRRIRASAHGRMPQLTRGQTRRHGRPRQKRGRAKVVLCRWHRNLRTRRWPPWAREHQLHRRAQCRGASHVGVTARHTMGKKARRAAEPANRAKESTDPNVRSGRSGGRTWVRPTPSHSQFFQSGRARLKALRKHLGR